MAAADNLLAALAANLAQPHSVRTDAGEVTSHDLGQQVAAIKLALQLSGARNPFSALRFAQTVSPNASGAADPSMVADLYPPPGVSGLPGYPQ